MHTQSFTRLALLMALSLSGFATKNVLDATKVRHRRVEMLDDMVHRRAEGMVEAHLVARMPEPAQLAPRQTIAANLTGSDPANLDQNMLDATISAACKAALGPIKSVDNDAGFLACYNIPFLNTNTGVFEADLRLYQISEPKGAFANIRPTDISVQLSFPNAAFSIIPQTTRKRRRDTVDLETRQSPGAMDELQNFLFVGQVSKDLTISKLEE